MNNTNDYNPLDSEFEPSNFEPVENELKPSNLEPNDLEPNNFEPNNFNPINFEPMERELQPIKSQYVTNLNLDKGDLIYMDDTKLGQVKTDWFVYRMYYNKNAGKVNIEYDKDKYYPSFISDYRISRVDKNGDHFYYITFYCTISLDSGVYVLTHRVSANYTRNSEFTHLLFNLNINPDGYNRIELDSLINMPVSIQLDTTKNGYNYIVNMKYRNN